MRRRLALAALAGLVLILITALVSRQAEEAPRAVVSPQEGVPRANPKPSQQRRPLSAVVTVDPRQKTGKKLSRLLFGQNIEWTNAAGGLWQPGSGRPHPGALRLLRALPVGSIRFPGGLLAESYRWRKTIGPFENRETGSLKPQADKRLPSYFGTDELLELGRTLGAPPLLLTINHDTGSPEEAAAWVHYLVDPQSTALGSLRAKNGHRDPYPLRAVEIGNETYGRTKVGRYASAVREFARAIKFAAPGVRVGAVGYDLDPRRATSWDRRLLEAAGKDIDFLVYHFYAPVTRRPFPGRSADRLSALLSAHEMYRQKIRDVRKTAAGLTPGRSVPLGLVISEFNAFYGTQGSRDWVAQPADLKSALFAGRMLQMFAEEGVEEANFWAVNSWFFRLLQAKSGEFAPAPAGLLYGMLSDHAGGEMVASTVDSPRYDSPAYGAIAPQKGVPYLTSWSTIDREGRLKLFLVNGTVGQPLEVEIAIRGGSVPQRVAVETLWSQDPDARAGGASPPVTRRSTSATEAEGADARLKLRLPPHSATTVEWQTPGAAR